VWALRRRTLNRVDRWDGRTYQRTVFAGNSAVEITVTQAGSTDDPRLHVDVEGETAEATRRFIRNLLNRVLGLDIDLAPFYQVAAKDRRLNDLASRFRGMRPPRFPTIFEALVNGIACQQLSLEAGLSLLNRLAASHGRAPPSGGEANKAPFPRPWDMASTSLESLRALGFSRSKGTAIIEIARAIERRDIVLDQLESLDDGTLQARLDELRGVGRWTAEYVLLRGYGRLNVFPGDDVGARNGLERWLGLRKPLDYQHTKSILRKWQPYSGLVYLHLLLKSLYEKGLIRASAELG
jgi:DNA-3-methyladenine glycosylase II